MKNVTVCFVYFRSLTLANLEAALYTLRRQDFSRVNSVVVLDNNTEDEAYDILKVIDDFHFPVPVSLHSHKHGDSSRTHAWSTNAAVHEVQTSWIFFTRADYLLAFDCLGKFVREKEARPEEWNGFVTGNGCHVGVNLATCELTSWRQTGPQALERVGAIYDYTCIDTGVWLGRKDAFDDVGGVDERLTAWGHAQTHFQWKLHKARAECVRIPEVLFYHPQHGGEKDLDLAHRQAAERGLDLREMWARYEGPRMY